MKKSVEMHKTIEIGTIPLETIAFSGNARVKKVLKRLKNKSFLEKNNFHTDYHVNRWGNGGHYDKYIDED